MAPATALAPRGYQVELYEAAKKSNVRSSQMLVCKSASGPGSRGPRLNLLALCR